MDFEQSEQTRRLVVVTALEALSKIYMNKDLLPKKVCFSFRGSIMKDMGNECKYCEATIEKMIHLKQKGWKCVCGKQL